MVDFISQVNQPMQKDLGINRVTFYINQNFS